MASKSKKGDELMVGYTTELPVALTEKELLDRGHELALCDSQIRDEGVHADKVKQDLKARMGNLELRRSMLAAVVRDKSEPRPVACEGWARHAEGVFEAIRTDTVEVVPGTRRRLSEEEQQRSLPLEGKQNGPVDLASL